MSFRPLLIAVLDFLPAMTGGGAAGAAGKSGGTYAALGNVSMLKYSLNDDFRVAP